MHDKVRGLVYVAAFAPDAGASAGSLGASVVPTPLATEIVPDGEGFVKLTRTGIFDSFAQDLPEAEREIIFATQGPTSVKALGGTLKGTAWKAKPSWAIVATEDRAIMPDLERTMARRAGADIVLVSASHLVMLSRPADVAALVMKAAQALSAS